MKGHFNFSFDFDFQFENGDEVRIVENILNGAVEQGISRGIKTATKESNSNQKARKPFKHTLRDTWELNNSRKRPDISKYKNKTYRSKIKSRSYEFNEFVTANAIPSESLPLGWDNEFPSWNDEYREMARSIFAALADMLGENYGDLDEAKKLCGVGYLDIGKIDLLEFLKDKIGKFHIFNPETGKPEFSRDFVIRLIENMIHLNQIESAETIYFAYKPILK